jgi:ATP-binding cassette, subfamily G (WHITE), member 2, SNQ2
MSESTENRSVEKLSNSAVNSIELESPAPKAIDPGGLDAIRILLRSQAPTEQGTAKQIGVSFKNLVVTAPAGTQVDVKTLPRAILNTFGPDQYQFIKDQVVARLLPKSTTPEGRPILNGFSGIVKPGEMLLVLGRPGSGCSTFLRTIANRTTLASTGDLEYANISASVFKKDHARETIYLPEEDKHIASLSVRQTIRFALRNSLPAQARDKELVSNLVEAIAKICGLSHALETPVGGPFSPGVSGGERKR